MRNNGVFDNNKGRSVSATEPTSNWDVGGVGEGVQTQRVYRLRSFLFCHQCGRRLYGKTKRSTPYYVCQPKKAWRADAHPTIYWVREDTLLDGLTDFLATRVFGAYRRELLADTLAAIDHTAQQQRHRRITTLRRALTDNDAKTKNLLRSLEVAPDIDADFIRQISNHSAELRAHRAQLEHDLATAQRDIDQAPNPTLIDQLPVIEPTDLAGLPDELSRRLFEAFRLEIRYDPTTRTASGQITLTGETIHAVAQISADTTRIPSPPAANTQPPPPHTQNRTHGTVCVVHPTRHNTNLNLLVSGVPVAVTVVHAKVRRAGYQRKRS
ncbi:MAG: zinc ribbon domain-containing protein [Pseudonocardiaceae bacterium]